MINYRFRTSFLCIVLILCSCVTPARVVTEKMDHWIGESINPFILSWGAPDSVYNLLMDYNRCSWEDYVRQQCIKIHISWVIQNLDIQLQLNHTVL